MKKTFTFNGKKFESESVASVGRLIQAISYAPNRLAQAINFAVEAALHHTQSNQLGPVKDLLVALTFSEHSALKKQGVKLQAYVKEEVPTLEVIVAKKQEKVVVKYKTEEGKRDLPEDLPLFSSWEIPKGEEKVAQAVTGKAVESLTSKWAKREKSLKAAGKDEALATEKLQLKMALMRALDELAPELELFKAEHDKPEDGKPEDGKPEDGKPKEKVDGPTILTEVEQEAEKLRKAEKAEKLQEAEKAA